MLACQQPGMRRGEQERRADMTDNPNLEHLARGIVSSLEQSITNGYDRAAAAFYIAIICSRLAGYDEEDMVDFLKRTIEQGPVHKPWTGEGPFT